MSEEWSSLSKAEREPYFEMYEKEKKRYFQEKAAAWLNSEGEELSDITG